MAVYDINRILVPDAPPEYEDHTRDVHYVPAPCQVACPIGTDAPSYIAYIWDEDYEGAFEAITATNPFSSICGRVCDAPCEPACRRVDSDGAVQIRNLKRFVMDKLGATYRPPAAPVTRKQSIGIVGAGPAGLVAAHDLCVAGYSVHVYEMTDRLGGMMIWGIPAFRLPPGIIEEDVERLMQRCPGLEVHLDTALGRDVSLEELKERHDAVLLTIGAWWGKPMGIAGEEDERVVDGVGFLRRVNAGERPEMPETVVVVGGGDVAMDACRVAKRLPGCKHVKVIYRRGPGEIPARKIELHHALKEDVEFLYHTQQVAVVPRGNQLALQCVKTALGEPDEDGRRRPVVIEGSEHEILCGSVIAAVGQRGLCEELDRAGMMAPDRVHTEWDSMRTSDPKVFAAGDGAFGGSTLVMAMQHGQRAAYYVRHFLEGNGDPLPYRTPYRTRRVPVAQDLMWEKFPIQKPVFEDYEPGRDAERLERALSRQSHGGSPDDGLDISLLVDVAPKPHQAVALEALESERQSGHSSSPPRARARPGSRPSTSSDCEAKARVIPSSSSPTGTKSSGRAGRSSSSCCASRDSASASSAANARSRVVTSLPRSSHWQTASTTSSPTVLMWSSSMSFTMRPPRAMTDFSNA